MRHHYKKIKLGTGQDATQMMLFKFTHNFLKSGVAVLTERRAKVLRSHLERLIVKAKSASQADRNMITSALRHRNLIKYMLETVGPSMKRETGFFHMEKLMPRVGDAAKQIRLTFVDEVPGFASMQNTSKKISDASQKVEKPEKSTKKLKVAKK